jgi:hypothetical protein
MCTASTIKTPMVLKTVTNRDARGGPLTKFGVPWFSDWVLICQGTLLWRNLRPQPQLAVNIPPGESPAVCLAKEAKIIVIKLPTVAPCRQVPYNIPILHEGGSIRRTLDRVHPDKDMKRGNPIIETLNFL